MAAVEEKKPVVYTHPFAYGGYAASPYAHGVYAASPYAHYNYAPVTYSAHHGLVKPYAYYANSGGAVHAVHKREAEAAPEANADPEAWYSAYSGYGYPRAYNYGAYGRYSPYTYGGYGGYSGYSAYRGYGGYGGYGYAYGK